MFSSSQSGATWRATTKPSIGGIADTEETSCSATRASLCEGSSEENNVRYWSGVQWAADSEAEASPIIEETSSGVAARMFTGARARSRGASLSHKPAPESALHLHPIYGAHKCVPGYVALAPRASPDPALRRSPRRCGGYSWRPVGQDRRFRRPAAFSSPSGRSSQW